MQADLHPEPSSQPSRGTPFALPTASSVPPASSTSRRKGEDLPSYLRPSGLGP